MTAHLLLGVRAMRLLKLVGGWRLRLRSRHAEMIHESSWMVMTIKPPQQLLQRDPWLTPCVDGVIDVGCGTLSRSNGHGHHYGRRESHSNRLDGVVLYIQKSRSINFIDTAVTICDWHNTGWGGHDSGGHDAVALQR
jgi:hypothetical protein